MTVSNNLAYRPEIDGLRAIAVLAVVFYHAKLGCPGGYVGVDIFFVISGYLITKLIWNDMRSGSFSFLLFWERRARRLLPAMFVVFGAIMVAGYALLLPIDFLELGEAAMSQSVFAANFHYLFNTGYFHGGAELKPLLHTWSLAVEEQFYLIMPGLLLLLFRKSVGRSSSWVISSLTIMMLISFSMSVFGVEYQPRATFFLLPTRAWELLLGALISFSNPRQHTSRIGFIPEVSSAIGIACICFSISSYDNHTRFPGAAALLPCIGTALIIWANQRSSGCAPSAVGKLLSIKPLVFVGLISYSLYLWHWPFFSFATYTTLGPVPIQWRIILLLLGFMAAVLSWKYVETPFRRKVIGGSRKSMISIATGALASMLIIGWAVQNARGAPWRVDLDAEVFSLGKSDVAFINEVLPDEIDKDYLPRIGVSDSSIEPTVVIWGDSHAMAALPAIDQYLQEIGVAGLAATHSSTAPLENWYRPGTPGLTGEEKVHFAGGVLSLVKAQGIRHVVLCAAWADYAGYPGATSRPFGNALLETVSSLVTAGAQPWIVLDVPAHPFDVPRGLAQNTHSLSVIDALCTTPSTAAQLDHIDSDILDRATALGAFVVNPKQSFLNKSQDRYIIHSNGRSLYRDDSHLSTFGAKLILLPLFHEMLFLRK